MYPYPQNQTCSIGALLLTPELGLLPTLLRAEHATVEDRVLRVQNGASERQYTG